MKVLYVGVFMDGTGWGHSACDYIRALDEAGVDVVARPLKLNKATPDIPPRIIELAGKHHVGKYDAVIQHVLPHHSEFNGYLGKNICLYFSETTHFRPTGWPNKLNLMDEAWVCNAQSKEASINSGVSVPINVVPIPCDISRYERSYKNLSLRKQLKDHFIFYWIGEFIHRKNLAALLRAFHVEFDINEPVSLVLKTSPKHEQTVYDAKRDIELFCKSIKEGLKIYQSPMTYKQEIVISGYFSEEEMLRLHSSCDCGVFPSFGESWNMAAFDSMALGKTPIVTDFGGFRDYLNNDCGWLSPCHLESVWGAHYDSIPDVYTAKEDWARIDTRSLMSAMRQAYEDKELRQSKSLAGMDRAHDFTYEKVGSKMKEILSND